LFPLFSQSVLGFSALKSGNFLLLPGVVLGCTMIFTGTMMQFKVPGRDLAMAGVVVEVFAMWLLGHLTPMSNESDAQIALAISRMGIGLLMLSTIVAGVGNLKPAAVGQGTALMGLARQLGGSFGIALCSTYVVQMTQFHRYDIASKVVSGSAGTSERLDMITGAFYARGMDMEHARSAAMTVLDGQVSRQAYTMAFNNAHIAIGMMFAITLPILFLMKRRGGAAAAAGAH
jgi:DHA2 family multidrug resistance protein